jgi:hypothetical protein
MIRIARGDEGTDFANHARKLRAAAMLAWARNKPPEPEYRLVARTLYERQWFKCAWCERACGFENQPVEHFRPKGGADDGRVADRKITRRDPDHYWWLAWTWSNLLFSCARCNGQATKGNWFPIAPGSKRVPAPPRELMRALPPECLDLASERALLIDPAADNPMDHIVWQPEDPSASWEALKWRPYGHDRQGRGTTTIKILGLEGDHARDVSNEINATITTAALSIVDALAQNDGPRVHRDLDTIEKRFAETSPFLAAKHDAWTWFLAQPTLAALAAPGPMSRAPIARPGAASDTTRAEPDVSPPSEFDSLSNELVLRILADDFANADEVLLAFASEKVRDVSVIQRLTERSLPSLQAADTRLLGVLALFEVHDSIARADVARVTGRSGNELTEYLALATAARVLVFQSSAKSLTPTGGSKDRYRRGDRP